MRPILAIVFLLSLQTIGFAQLIKPIDERPRLPDKIERAAKVPTDLAGKATLTFVELSVIFDGGSYGALFRRGDGHQLVVFFLHPGYWSKQALSNETQPIVVQVDRAREDDVQLEVEPDSPFEKRLIELLNDDLTNNLHSQEQIKTLTQVRDCIVDRKPLAEIRKRFPSAFKK